MPTPAAYTATVIYVYFCSYFGSNKTRMQHSSGSARIVRDGLTESEDRWTQGWCRRVGDVVFYRCRDGLRSGSQLVGGFSDDNDRRKVGCAVTELEASIIILVGHGSGETMGLVGSPRTVVGGDRTRIYSRLQAAEKHHAHQYLKQHSSHPVI